MGTEVMSIRVRKELKEQADSLGIDVREVLERLLEEMVAAEKRKAEKTAEELKRLMDVTVEGWMSELKKTRQES